MGALALALILAAAPGAKAKSPETAKSPPPAEFAPPEAVAPLAEAARRIDALPIQQKKVADVKAVRKRLDALAALAAMATVHVQGSDLAARRAAHFVVGSAHERFADELLSTRPPPEAMQPAAREAWDEQLQGTGLEALRTASAHLRSCADLPSTGGSDAALATVCQGRIERLPGLAGGGKSPLPKGAQARIRAITGLRMPELQSCIDAWTESHPRAGPLEVQATVATDSIGGVESVRLSPSGVGRDALYECLSDGLRMWVFPGVTDAEIELPIRIQSR